ncbi:hypothetical protein [Microbacterium sp. BK668]|uniref:hypothetical protein n=1 Tax=Microbacterium sp. BK668 TaxID=2512118 RepID=UPI00105EE41B|nr:hypothetical protein [Microbacterium sp. BK668]TDN90914.1 hypothetical protein EV279_0407 [Microbacterium sp. BK668]
MTVQDAYAQRYAAKLWSLVPEHHRAADSESIDAPGPLRELLARIGWSMADVRRSIDRLWEDQSVETADSWVIPYLADLLATRLVPSMDARGQRLDVFRTILYRRAKGTVQLLERLANDVTGYDARVIEFFSSLARTRHGLDPAIGWPADSDDPVGARRLQHAERLTGARTGTPAGGWADLRDPLGASLAHSPFDEFHHCLDVRIGRGDLGWHGIPKVGFFLWRTEAMRVDRATPVPVAACPGHFAFDPTGRRIPLFLAPRRGANDYGEAWLPVPLWQLPTPLTEPLWDAILDPDDPFQPEAADTWPRSLSVSPTGAGAPLDVADVRVWPEVGRFQVLPGGPAEVEVGYHHGLFSRIGAGPYDRRRPGVRAPVDPVPRTRIDGGSAVALPGAIAGLSGTGTVVVRDGRTLTATGDVPAVRDVVIRAEDGERAVVRGAGGVGGAEWVFTGAGGRLRLEGLLVSGTDIVLRGDFAEVAVSCCTLDPGGSGALHTPSAVWDEAVDGRELTPTTVWIEGTVDTLRIDRSITGPIRTRTAGLVDDVVVTDSVVQGLPAELPGDLDALRDADAIASALRFQREPLGTWLAGQLDAATAAAVATHQENTPAAAATASLVRAALQAVIDGPLIWDAARFGERLLSASTVAAAAAVPTEADSIRRLNRLLLAEGFPLALGDAALALESGRVRLERSTILGRAYVHRLECSESILDDVVLVRDTQDGCVRFSAWASGSRLPRRYESVEVAPGAPVMVSRRYGEWGYAQLSDGADSAIRSGNTSSDPSLLSGAENRSEMGVFCRDLASVKDRSLLLKAQEYLPVGLAPVLIHLPEADPVGELTRGRPWPPM